MKLYFDTETTGLYDRRDFHNHVGLPAIMEYAHLLIDDEWNVVEKFETLVQLPDSCEIHERAYAAHGITREEANEKGIPFFQVLDKFWNAIARARMVVGYNISYDLDMMEIGYHRACSEGLTKDNMAIPQAVDLMRYATPICALPGRRPGDYKWPKLEEAMRIICGCTHKGHRALADTLACVTLHQKLVNMQESRRHADS